MAVFLLLQTIVAQDISATIYNVETDPDPKNVYSDDPYIAYIDIKVYSSADYIQIGCPFNCHYVPDNDNIKVEFVNDITNPYPLSGTISPSDITFSSGGTESTTLEIDTRLLPYGPYKYQIKVTDLDTSSTLLSTLKTLHLIDTYNPLPNPSQTNNRLVILENNVTEIKQDINEIISLGGIPGPKGDTGDISRRIMSKYNN
ncbi:MAG: hypothetical protein DA328_06945 [Nitrososphaeraceae archaeon]|nr:hypothetical protein [Nitrososphaeraceae archaeon]